MMDETQSWNSSIYRINIINVGIIKQVVYYSVHKELATLLK
jgi:hypothetical protein